MAAHASGRMVGGGLVLLGLAAAASAMAIDLDPSGGWGARLFPLIGSAAILAAGLAELAAAGRIPAPASSDHAPSDLRAVAAMVALALAYVWIMGHLGYLISTALAAPLALALFGIRRPAALLAGAVLAPLAYHLVFFRALGVFPPMGDWFDLLDVVAL